MFSLQRKHMYVYVYYFVVSHVGVQKTMTYKRDRQEKRGKIRSKIVFLCPFIKKTYQWQKSLEIKRNILFTIFFRSFVGSL